MFEGYDEIDPRARLCKARLCPGKSFQVRFRCTATARNANLPAILLQCSGTHFIWLRCSDRVAGKTARNM